MVKGRKSISEQREALRKKQKAREIQDLKLKKKRKKIDERKALELIILSDELFKQKRFKEAYHRLETARNVALNYNEVLLPVIKNRIKIIKVTVLKRLNKMLTEISQEVESHFNTENFDKVKPLTRKFKLFIREYQWVGVNELLLKFQEKILDLWEGAYPKLVELADSYYDKRQYDRARRLFTRCKGIVKECQFNPGRSHLIRAFMRYELLCDVQLTIADMIELNDQALQLVESGNFNEALFELGKINKLESRIPIQFRDKKRLNQIHIKMNHLREQIIQK